MLKVMSLNLNYYVTKHGDWSARRDLIAEAIREAGPDVVALQAVRRDPRVAGGMDQAQQLAEMLPGYRHVYFQPASEAPDGSAEGSAFLARVPMAGTNYLALTLCDGWEDTNRRVLLQADLDLPEGRLHLYNAHFSWVAPQARLNLAETLPFVQGRPGPALLVGDLNTLPTSDLWEPLLAAGWQDAWGWLRPEDEGLTFESDRLFMRIDYAWANRDLAGRLAAMDVVARERDGARMSDHLGIVLTVN